MKKKDVRCTLTLSGVDVVESNFHSLVNLAGTDVLGDLP